MDKSTIKIMVSLVIAIGLFVLNAMLIWATGFSLILMMVSSFSTGYFIAKRNKRITPERPKINNIPEEVLDAEKRFRAVSP